MRRYRSVFPLVATALAFYALLVSDPGYAQGGLLEFLFGPDSPGPSGPPPRQRDTAPARRARVQGAVGELRFIKPRDGAPGAGTGFASEPAAGGFCVRTCDGYFFPLIKSTKATRQQSCELACPSAPMEIYDGPTIENARNYKGQKYTALRVAFAFRDRASGACVCNDPKSSQKFFQETARHDPTLQSGDVVVETNGAFVYSGSKLVPLSNASFMSSQLRDRLRAMLRRTKPSLNETIARSTPPELEVGKNEHSAPTPR